MRGWQETRRILKKSFIYSHYSTCQSHLSTSQSHLFTSHSHLSTTRTSPLFRDLFLRGDALRRGRPASFRITPKETLRLS
jgi:hypothetical protein